MMIRTSHIIKSSIYATLPKLKFKYVIYNYIYISLLTLTLNESDRIRRLIAPHIADQHKNKRTPTALTRRQFQITVTKTLQIYLKKTKTKIARAFSLG
jgi:hypothetical protein